MGSSSTRRGVAFGLALFALACVAGQREARAIEAFDGRIQAHGFLEMQVRGISEKFGINDNELDLAMWYNIFNLELEFDILPDGWGPIDLLQAYVRVEARYDCIYSHGCGIFPNVNTFGNDVKRLPRRLRDAEDPDYAGVIRVGEPINRIQNKKPAKVGGVREEVPFGDLRFDSTAGEVLPDQYRDDWRYAAGNHPFTPGSLIGGFPRCDPSLGCPGEPGELIPPELNPLAVETIVERLGFPGFDTFYDQVGGDLIPNTADDPAIYFNGKLTNYRFGLKDFRGPAGGAGTTQFIGPWRPKDTVIPRAFFRDAANPFRGRPTRLLYTDRAIPPVPNGCGPVFLPGGCGTDPGEPNYRYNTRSTDIFTDPLEPLLVADAGPPPTFTDLVDPFPEELVNFWETDYYFTAPKDARFPNQPALPLSTDPNQPFGGDYSGLIPCFEPARAPSDFPSTDMQRQYDGTNKRSGCIPFTNVRVTGGRGELPMRVAPDRSNLFAKFDERVAQGLYIPSPGLVRYYDNGDFDPHDFNITETERAWNRGASQQDNKELKEAFVDIEWLDSRLWTRFGLQNIVWGKTELFRTTDQFNPQDFALQTIPGLEESRIALWAARFVYSFYSVGPLEDVRAEFAVNLDDVEPNDLGACGEPYTFNVICSITTGMLAHGFLGLGVAGVDRPPKFYQDVDGIEFGGRIEWRWDRFSFAVTDFYGYDDFPYADAIYYFDRSVEFALEDLDTREFVTGAGRPLANGFSSGCTGEWGMDGDMIWASANRDPKDYRSMTPAGIGRDPACLKPGGAAGGLNQNGFTVDRDQTLSGPDGSCAIGEICFVKVDQYGNPINIGDTSSPIFPVVYDPCDPDVMPVGCEPLRYEVGLLENTTSGMLYADGLSPQNALEYHTANQQSFAWICANTVTIGAALDEGACAFTLFGSPALLQPQAAPVPFSEVFTCVAAGEIDRDCNNFLSVVSNNLQGTRTTRPPAQVPLNRDVMDGYITAQHPLVNRAAPPDPGDDPFWGFLPYRRFLQADNDMLTMDSTLTNEQRALIGCGPYYGTRCDSAAKDSTTNPFINGRVLCTLLGTGCNQGGGLDFLNMEGGVMVMSFVGIDGTDLRDPIYTDNPDYAQWAAGGANFSGTEWAEDGIWLATSGLPQPGTIEFLGGPTCTRFVPELNDTIVLPGCRGAHAIVNRATARDDGFIMFEFDDGYDPRIDGCAIAEFIDGVEVRGRYDDGSPVDLTTCWEDSNHKDGFYFQTLSGRDVLVPSTTEPGSGTLWHPYAGCFADPADAVAGADCVTTKAGEQQQFPTDVGRDYEAEFFNDDVNTQSQIFRNELAAWSWNMQQFLVVASCDADEDDIVGDPECFDPRTPYKVGKCSWSTPQYCTNVKGFFGAAGVLRNTVRAAGNGRFGRRTFIWHSGGELVLKYQRRNVFGFSLDFGEDITKSNWGAEFTWVNKQNFFNNDDYTDNVTQSDVFNLTISVDRPTFINFLNANRTFFINSQWFFQYVPGYEDGFAANGPVNVLATFAVFTGYFQDRLNPMFVLVYDFLSSSGGILPSVSYRFTESFSVGVGVSFFFGHTELNQMAGRPFAPAVNRTGKIAYKDGVDNLLANFRDKDEVWLKLRWTF